MLVCNLTKSLLSVPLPIIARIYDPLRIEQVTNMPLRYIRRSLTRGGYDTLRKLKVPGICCQGDSTRQVLREQGEIDWEIGVDRISDMDVMPVVLGR